MYCLKCGRDTEAEQVFCEACLDGMGQYPVKPGTAVTLPHRERGSVIKKQPTRKRAVPPEEQVLLMRKQLHRMTLALIALTLALSLVTAMFVKEHLEETAEPSTGRNYTVDTGQQP